MKRLDPDPGDEIRLEGLIYSFEPHPVAPWTVYAAEGRKAVVYRLQSEDGPRSALKIFKQRYRGKHLLESPTLLRPLLGLEGLSIARRSVVHPASDLAARYPEAAYGVLMPWMEGHTWYDLLMEARNKNGQLHRQTSLHLGHRFLSVLRGLEERTFAHSDIAAGNVTLSPQSGTVELLDIEDVFMPDREPPRHRSRGSAGYQHPSLQNDRDCWCAEGDRYAAAVLAAEILILSNADLTAAATEEGLLQNCSKTAFDESLLWLRRIAPDFADVFLRAWGSVNLECCPTLAELQSALRPALASDEVGQGWIEVSISSKSSSLPRKGPVAGWEPLVASWETTKTTRSSKATPNVKAASPSRPAGGIPAPRARKAPAGYTPVFLLLALLIALLLMAGTGHPEWLLLLVSGMLADLALMAFRNKSP